MPWWISLKSLGRDLSTFYWVIFVLYFTDNMQWPPIHPFKTARLCLVTISILQSTDTQLFLQSVFKKYFLTQGTNILTLFFFFCDNFSSVPYQWILAVTHVTTAFTSQGLRMIPQSLPEIFSRCCKETEAIKTNLIPGLCFVASLSKPLCTS